MRGARCCSLVVAAVLLFAVCVASQSSGNGTNPEINSSILVFGPSDYALNGGRSRCQQMVSNALAYRQSRLMFVPTGFWVDLGYRELKTVNSQASMHPRAPP